MRGVVADYAEVYRENGISELVPVPPIQYFKFERRPMPEKKNHNGLIMGTVSTASFFAGISLIGICIRPVAAVPVLIGSLAYITLVAYANFRKERS